jgi:hypothetical protein
MKRIICGLILLAVPAWAARSFNGSSDHINCGNPSLLTGTNYSVVAWMRPATVSDGLSHVAVGWRSTSASNPITLQIDHVDTQARFIVRDGSGNIANSTLSSSIALNTWHCVVGTRSGNTAQVYVDGVAGASSTVTLGTITTNSLNIGAVVNGSATRVQYFSGHLAEVAIWNATLTADEALALGRGVPPILVRPQSLVFWVPLVRDIRDLRNGTSLTASGAATVVDHPRIFGRGK